MFSDRTDDRRHRDSSRTTFSPHRDARATDSHRLVSPNFNHHSNSETVTVLFFNSLPNKVETISYQGQNKRVEKTFRCRCATMTSHPCLLELHLDTEICQSPAINISKILILVLNANFTRQLYICCSVLQSNIQKILTDYSLKDYFHLTTLWCA